jgi:hypothetical protein
MKNRAKELGVDLLLVDTGMPIKLAYEKQLLTGSR